ELVRFYGIAARSPPHSVRAVVSSTVHASTPKELRATEHAKQKQCLNALDRARSQKLFHRPVPLREVRSVSILWCWTDAAAVNAGHVRARSCPHRPRPLAVGSGGRRRACSPRRVRRGSAREGRALTRCHRGH